MGGFAQLWRNNGRFQHFRDLKVCATLVRHDDRTVAAASSGRSRMTRLLDVDGICATMGSERILKAGVGGPDETKKISVQNLLCHFGPPTRTETKPSSQRSKTSWPSWPTSLFHCVCAGLNLANLINTLCERSPDPAQTTRPKVSCDSLPLVNSLPSVQKSSLQFCCHHATEEFGVKVRATSSDFDHSSYFIGFSKPLSIFSS